VNPVDPATGGGWSRAVEPWAVGGALLVFALLTTALYVAARWGAARAVAQLSSGVEYGVNLLAVGLLLPEYLVTRVTRRASGRAAPLAYAYGDAVCGLACGTHRCAAAVMGTLHDAARRIDHRTALVISLLLSAALLYSART